MQWCLNEAKAKNLKESDFWGGLIFDEMKIEVQFINVCAINIKSVLSDSDYLLVVNSGCHASLNNL